MAKHIIANHYPSNKPEKVGKKKGSFMKALDAHKAKGASFDNGTWKPSYKGETFIQSLEKHKSQRQFD